MGDGPHLSFKYVNFPMFMKVTDNNTDVQVLEYDENCAETLKFVETRNALVSAGACICDIRTRRERGASGKGGIGYPIYANFA